VAYLVANEWARTADDVLWRRTKAGLHLAAREVDAVERYLARRA
jgi:glycerol-3-phosphate dehydrogenase